MKIIDLTHVIHEHMPVFPGTEPPIIKEVQTIEVHKNREKRMTMCSHIGTHIDAPAHMKQGGKTLDELPINHFMGSGLVVDCRQTINEEITLELLKSYEGQIKKADFVLFLTGFSSRWGRETYFDKFPVMTVEAVQWLVKQGLKGVGLDGLSIDALDSEDFEIHHILFEHNLVVIENLNHLDTLLNKAFTFICYPLKIKEADGSPIRAVAILKNE